jgi:hypothetical protein
LLTPLRAGPSRTLLVILRSDRCTPTARARVDCGTWPGPECAASSPWPGGIALNERHPYIRRYTLNLRATSGSAQERSAPPLRAGDHLRPSPTLLARAERRTRPCRSAGCGNPGRTRPEPGHPFAFRQEWLFRVDLSRWISVTRTAGSGASRPLWRTPGIVFFLNP